MADSIGALFDSKRPAGVTRRAFAIETLKMDYSRYFHWTKRPDILPNLLDLFEIGARVGLSEEDIREVYETVRKQKEAKPCQDLRAC
jgi:hypothetical protein